MYVLKASAAQQNGSKIRYWPVFGEIKEDKPIAMIFEKYIKIKLGITIRYT